MLYSKRVHYAIYGTVGVCILVVLPIVLGRYLIREYRYAVHGAVTVGTVLKPEKEDTEPAMSARPPDNRVRYEFVDENGEKHVSEVVLSPGAPRYQPGETIKIRYLKDSPE